MPLDKQNNLNESFCTPEGLQNPVEKELVSLSCEVERSRIKNDNKLFERYGNSDFIAQLRKELQEDLGSIPIQYIDIIGQGSGELLEKHINTMIQLFQYHYPHLDRRSAQKVIFTLPKQDLQDLTETLVIDKNISAQSEEYFFKYFKGSKLEDFKKFFEEKQSIFQFFDQIDEATLPRDYIYSLAQNNFPVQDFVGNEHIFQPWSIKYITYLYNRPNTISSQDLIFYFSLLTKDDAKNDTDETLHKYIELIDSIIGDNYSKKIHNQNIKELREQGMSIPTIYNFMNWYSSIDPIRLQKITNYKADLGTTGEHLGEIEISNWLIRNNIKPKQILPYLQIKHFSAKDLAFLHNNENWNLNYTLKEKVEIVQKFLEINPDFSGKDIVHYQELGLGLGALDKDRSSEYTNEEIIKSYIQYDSHVNIEEFLALNEKYGAILDTNEREQIDQIKKLYPDISYHNIAKLLKMEAQAFDALIKKLNQLKNEYFEDFPEQEHSRGKEQHLNAQFEHILGYKYTFSLLEYLSVNTEEKIRILQEDGETLSEISINGNLQFLVSLLDFRERFPEGTPWKEVIGKYEKFINEYLESSREVDTVFYMGANHYYGEDKDGMLYSKNLEKIFGEEKVKDFTVGINGGEKLDNTTEIIIKLEDYLKQFPNKKVLFFISGHGSLEGSVSFSRGWLEKKHFEAINSLSKTYPNLHIVINSCNNGTKFDNLQGNIFLNAIGQGFAFSTFDNQLEHIADTKLADINKNGITTPEELNMYMMIHYQSGIIIDNGLKSFYTNKLGGKVPIHTETKK